MMEKEEVKIEQFTDNFTTLLKNTIESFKSNLAEQNINHRIQKHDSKLNISQSINVKDDEVYKIICGNFKKVNNASYKQSAILKRQFETKAIMNEKKSISSNSLIQIKKRNLTINNTEVNYSSFHKAKSENKYIDRQKISKTLCK